MCYNASWEATGRSASHEILRLFWNKKGVRRYIRGVSQHTK